MGPIDGRDIMAHRTKETSLGHALFSSIFPRPDDPLLRGVDRMKRKLVLIEWVDSHEGRGWRSISDIENTAELLYCRSVGWLISENPDCVIIASHISGEKNEGIKIYACGDMCIPKCSIKKTTVLRTG